MKRHGELERVLSRWRRHLEREDDRPTVRGEPVEPRVPDQQLLAEQIKHLRAEVDELRGRLNGLLFTVIGAVVVQLVLRLLE